MERSERREGYVTCTYTSHSHIQQQLDVTPLITPTSERAETKLADRHLQGLTSDDVDFDSIWTLLSTAFQEIHCKNASKLSFEELFRGAYKLVLKKKQDALYDRVVDLEKTWLRDTVRARITALITPAMSYDLAEQAVAAQSNERRIAGERFIRALKDSFADHQLCMSMITDVLMYMVSLFCPLLIL